MRKFGITVPVLLILVLYTGCSGSGSLQQEDRIPADKLIGSWKTDYNLNSKRGILTFRPDSIFVDSVFTITTDSLKLIPELVIKGSYYLDGPLIKIKEANVTYPDNYPNEYIDNLAGYLRGETLYLQPVTEFKPGTLSQRSPAGEWITKRWICTYDKNMLPHVNNGFVTEIYDFDITSMKCRISREYLFDNSPASNDTVVNFVYKNRELTLGGTQKKWLVFYQNKIYWFNQNYYRYNRYELSTDIGR